MPRGGVAGLDFRTLHLPRDVAAALCEAFWERLGAARLQTIFDHWNRLRQFGRFNHETRAVRSLGDLQGDILVRYVKWLNTQRTAQGKPLAQATRASTYSSLHKLLQWLARCRPALLGPLGWPINPFPWRNRDTRARRALSASQVREILKACEHTIAEIRLMRQRGAQLRAVARVSGEDISTSPGALLELNDRDFGGVLSPTPLLYREHNHVCRCLFKHVEVDVIEPYQNTDSLRRGDSQLKQGVTTEAHVVRCLFPLVWHPIIVLLRTSGSERF